MNVEVQKWPSMPQLQLQKACFGPQARHDDNDDDDDYDDDASGLMGKDFLGLLSFSNLGQLKGTSSHS